MDRKEYKESRESAVGKEREEKVEIWETLVYKVRKE